MFEQELQVKVYIWAKTLGPSLSYIGSNYKRFSQTAGGWLEDGEESFLGTGKNSVLAARLRKYIGFRSSKGRGLWQETWWHGFRGDGGEVGEKATLRTFRAPHLSGFSLSFQLSAYILDLMCLYIPSLCSSFPHAPARGPYRIQGGGGRGSMPALRCCFFCLLTSQLFFRWVIIWVWAGKIKW